MKSETTYSDSIKNLNKAAFLKRYKRVFPDKTDGEAEFVRLHKEKEVVKA